MSFGSLSDGLSSFGNTFGKSVADFGHTLRDSAAKALDAGGKVSGLVGDIGDVVSPVVGSFNPQAGNFVSGVSSGLHEGKKVAEAISPLLKG